MNTAGLTSPRSVYAGRLLEFSDFVFTEQAVFQHRGQWREFFRKRIGPAFDNRIIFEIGCFDAGYLSRIAAQYPATGFIGLDWKCKPLHDGARRIVEQGVQNIALLRSRGQNVAKIFADREVNEIWVFHPDPCDRPKELQNRLFAEPFLMDAHRVLHDRTSALCLKTDHPGYYQSVFDLLATQSQFRVTTNSTDYWQDTIAQAATASRCFAGEMTLFERRFVNKRKRIYYIDGSPAELFPAAHQQDRADSDQAN